MGSRKQHRRRPRRVTLAKAAPSAPQRQAPADDDPEGVHRLTNLEVPLVSIVTAGANRQTQWAVVKEDATMAKAVPEASASPEDKRAAQAARARQYGIEARPDGALSYPADAPTVERLYGDPVNLAYPMGGPGNTVDVARTRNALARFKQNANRYGQARSRAVVYARIVRQALAAGITVSYDPNDPVDRLLPADLKQRLAKGTAPTVAPPEEAPAGAAPPDPAPPVHQADRDAWIRRTGARLAELQLALALQPAAGPPAGAAPPPLVRKAQTHVGPGDAPPTAPGTGAPPEPLQVALAKVAQQEQEIAALRAEARRLRSQRSVGAASALVAGNLPGAASGRATTKADPLRSFPMNGTVNVSKLLREQGELE